MKTNNGFIFTTDALVGLLVLVTIASLVTISYTSNSNPTDDQNWKHVQVMATAHAKNIQNNASATPPPASDHFCFTVLKPSALANPAPIQYCEETS